MLKFLDILFLWLHIVIILFNLFGWVWVKARKIHLFVVLGTVFSWLVLGLKYGLGYCFLTDWHWNIKYKLGERDMPASFIKYFLDEYTGLEISPSLVDLATGLSFGLVFLLTIYLNFRHSKLFSGKRHK